MNEAVKNLSINFNYSYLVIAKITMLNNEYAIIKDTLFQDIEKLSNENYIKHFNWPNQIL